MKPKIKYDVNVLGMKNKKSMMKIFFFYEETMQHNRPIRLTQCCT